MNKRLIATAMHRSDDLVVTLDYLDTKGHVTRRVVSPIRFVAADRFLALCLCRCEPRQFQLDRCSNLRLAQAAEFTMPVEMAAVEMAAVS
jgi:predicted DNA-binding transcriptional regulator YafY